MHPINKFPSIILTLALLISFSCISFAQEADTFKGRVNADNINVRCDSTVNSEIICKINKNDLLEVILESYGWYKVKLPKYAPSFVKKNLLNPIDEKSARAAEDNVNIRLKDNGTSPILGKLKKGELVNILRDKGEWIRIEPTDNSFGWVHKKFIDKARVENKAEEMQLAKKIEENESKPAQDIITLEGTIRPKAIKRIATHKLIAQDNKLFLLRGDEARLNSFNHCKVRASGKLIAPDDKQKLPTVEIDRIEALD